MLVREGLLAVLQHAGIDVVATCESLPELLAAVDDQAPDVVLTDIRMPPTGTDEGIRAALALRDSHPGTAVVVLPTLSETREFTLAALTKYTSCCCSCIRSK